MSRAMPSSATARHLDQRLWHLHQRRRGRSALNWLLGLSLWLLRLSLRLWCPPSTARLRQRPAPVISDDLPPWEVPPADAYLASMPEPSESLEKAVGDSYAAPEPTHPAPALASAFM